MLNWEGGTYKYWPLKRRGVEILKFGMGVLVESFRSVRKDIHPPERKLWDFPYTAQFYRLLEKLRDRETKQTEIFVIQESPTRLLIDFISICMINLFSTFWFEHEYWSYKCIWFFFEIQIQRDTLGYLRNVKSLINQGRPILLNNISLLEGWSIIYVRGGLGIFPNRQKNWMWFASGSLKFKRDPPSENMTIRRPLNMWIRLETHEGLKPPKNGVFEPLWGKYSFCVIEY